MGAKFEHYGVMMQTRPAVVKLNKPISVGFSILDKSKAHFQKMPNFGKFKAKSVNKKEISKNC